MAMFSISCPEIKNFYDMYVYESFVAEMTVKGEPFNRE